MTQLPSYKLSLADGRLISLESVDEHSAALLAIFAAATQLEQGNGLGRRILVSAKDGNRGDTTTCVSYKFRPLISGKVSFHHLFGLSHAIANQAHGGLLLHGALAKYRGRGVILIAKGGTGKTTASERLPSPWHSLSDDITLVVRDASGEYWAHPWPTWSRFEAGGEGGSWNTQQAVPLKAICHLSQSGMDWLDPLGNGRAVIFLTQSAEQVFLPVWHEFVGDVLSRYRLQRFERICTLVQHVQCNELHLSLTGSFWQFLEDAFENKAGDYD